MIERDLVADARAGLAASSWPDQAQELRALGAAAVGGGFSIVHSAAVAAKQAAEAAAMRTMTLAGSYCIPAFLGDVVAEVKRRSSILGDVQAWESVGDDLAAGRWRP